MEKLNWRESWTKRVFKLIGIENHRKITSKQCGNLRSLEAEIKKRQTYKKKERRPYWKMALACLANQSWPSSAPASLCNLFENLCDKDPWLLKEFKVKHKSLCFNWKELLDHLRQLTRRGLHNTLNFALLAKSTSPLNPGKSMDCQIFASF